MPTSPPAGAYAVGMAYLPQDDDERALAEQRIADIAARRAFASSPGVTCP
jgi:hypothetical protein